MTCYKCHKHNHFAKDCQYRSEEMWGGSAHVTHRQEMDVLTADGKFLRSWGVARVRHVHENPVKVEVLVVESKSDCMLKQLGRICITEFGDVRFCKPPFCAAINIRAELQCRIQPIHLDLNCTIEVVKWTPARVSKNTRYPSTPCLSRSRVNTNTNYRHGWKMGGWCLPRGRAWFLSGGKEQGKGLPCVGLPWTKLTYTIHADSSAENLAKEVFKVSLLDLQKTYLWIQVYQLLWAFSNVHLEWMNEWRYCPTRMGFGLNLALAVMKVIVETVLVKFF